MAHMRMDLCAAIPTIPRIALCKNCRAVISEGMNFCCNCGVPIYSEVFDKFQKPEDFGELSRIVEEAKDAQRT